MKIYNTLTKKIEEFIPRDKNEVKMYTCGPTVYHYAHIGNLRTYIEEDVLEKSLIYLGYPVKRVMNITDVGHLTSDADTGEDKMLKGAQREHKSVLEIAKFYTDAFFEDFKKLNIKKPDTIVPATSLIDDYIKPITAYREIDYNSISSKNTTHIINGITNLKDIVNVNNFSCFNGFIFNDLFNIIVSTLKQKDFITITDDDGENVVNGFRLSGIGIQHK